MKRLVLVSLLAALAAAQSLYLKDGDRVVFYGDSITQQRLYTAYVETFLRTRLPDLKVSFVHSGWGGDRVGGGGGGTIETRLERDVIAYRPTVVTIMLGMNDGRYRPFDKPIFDAFTTGYEKIVQTLKQRLPGVRITVIKPSPYDEVTREPMKNGGYNPVLVKFGEFLDTLAAKEQLTVADLNTPVVAMLQKAHAANAEAAARIIPDRVHPGPAGHLIMAAALLKAWNAPGRIAANGLPFPVALDDPTVALAVRSSDFMETLNQQPFRKAGLAPGHYALRIDGEQVGVFTAEQLAAGLNLATLPTPMLRQAEEVLRLTIKHNDTHFARWRTLEVPFAEDGFTRLKEALAALDGLEAEIVARQIAAAQPQPRRIETITVPAVAANVPPGFTPIFNGLDLTGWHISQTNHHGQTKGWTVQGGVLSGTQDKPGHGGILLTDKQYKNFEIYLEVNPDYGCDGGLFLRSSEKGEAYQVLLDYRDKGELAGIYGERLKGVVTWFPPNWREHWKQGEWNSIRARIEGAIPRIQVWMNGVRLTDWSDTANHAAGGAAAGMIAVQVHGGNQIWKMGGAHRFRNIAVRELPGP